MRLIRHNVEHDGSGSISLCPEEKEDMWHAYNLIAVSDLLRAHTIRRITSTSATGSTDSKREHCKLLIRVTAIDFDPQAGELHVSGQVAEENKFVKIGAYHTLDLEMQRPFDLQKKDGWDSVALEVVREAIKENKEGMVPAVVMEEGLANICFITEYQTVLKQRIEVSIPRKRRGHTGDHDNGLVKFYAVVLETLKRHVDLTEQRPLLVASPGFIAAGFMKYMLERAMANNDKEVLANKANFIVAHSSSGHLHSLNQVLKDPQVLAKLADTKYARETSIMNDFMEMLRLDNDKAWYGPTEVEKAVAAGAVGIGGGVLLINNNLFRSQVVGERKRWVALVDKVKEAGGEARVLSSDHESGKRLESLGGIAAILTYPMEDLDDEDVDETEAGEGEMII